jgi:hypothetical protein
MSEIMLTLLKNSLISFFDEMIEIFPKEPDFIKIRIFLKDQVEIQTVMDIFTYTINRTDNNNETLKNMIKDRNDVYIMDSHIISENFSKDKIIYYKKFWNSPMFVNEDKKIVWKWLDSFVSISEKYNKLK